MSTREPNGNYYNYVVVNIQSAGIAIAVAAALFFVICISIRLIERSFLINARWNSCYERNLQQSKLHWPITVAYWKIKNYPVTLPNCLYNIKSLKPQKRDNPLITWLKTSIDPALYVTVFTVQQLVIIFVYFLMNLVVFLVPFNDLDRNWDRDAKSGKLGAMAMGNITFMFATVVRNKYIRTEIFTGFEGSIFLHKYIGRFILLLCILHVGFTPQSLSIELINNLKTYFMSSNRINMGTAAFVLIIILCVISIGIVRRACFELFYYAHILLGIMFSVFAFIHVGNTSWKYVIPGFIIFTFDIALRVASVIRNMKASISKVAIHEDHSIRIVVDLPKHCIDYVGSQFVFIMIPSLSCFTFHPFSIVPYYECGNIAQEANNKISFLIKKTAFHYGFTNSVLKCGPELENRTILIDGPYGAPNIRFENQIVNIFFAGGIGITPMIAMIKHQLDILEQIRYDLILGKRLILVWSIRSLYDAEFLKIPFLKEIQRSTQLGSSKVTLEIQIYITGKEHNSDLEASTSEDVELSIYSNHSEMHPKYSNQRLIPAGFVNDNDGIKIIYGRPKVGEILASAKFGGIAESSMSSIGDIAVGVCGPKNLIMDVRNSAILLSDTSGLVLLHEEAFLM